MTVGSVLILYVLMVLYLPSLIYNINILSEVFHFTAMRPSLIVGIYYACILVGTIIPFLFLKSAFKIKMHDFWRPCAFRIRDFFVYVVVFIALGSSLVFLVSIINIYIPIGENVLLGVVALLPTDYVETIIFSILYCLAVPILEEIAFRGILLRALGVYGNRFALITGAIIYALLQPNFASFIPAFFMAIFLINLTLRYKSIVPAIAVHIVFNIFMYGFEFIPADLLLVATGLIFVIYLLALYFIISRHYIYAKVKKSEAQGMVMALFYTRPTIIIAFVLSIFFTVIVNIL